jgi:hypothetical protein
MDVREKNKAKAKAHYQKNKETLRRKYFEDRHGVEHVAVLLNEHGARAYEQYYNENQERLKTKALLRYYRLKHGTEMVDTHVERFGDGALEVLRQKKVGV